MRLMALAAIAAAIGTFWLQIAAAVPINFGSLQNPVPFVGTDPPTPDGVWKNGIFPLSAGAGTPFAADLDQDIFNIFLKNADSARWVGFHVELGPENSGCGRDGRFLFFQPDPQHPQAFAHEPAISGVGMPFTVASNCFQMDIPSFQLAGGDNLGEGDILWLHFVVFNGTNIGGLHYHLVIYPIVDTFVKSPEPSTITLLLSGLLGWGAVRWWCGRGPTD